MATVPSGRHSTCGRIDELDALAGRRQLPQDAVEPGAAGLVVRSSPASTRQRAVARHECQQDRGARPAVLADAVVELAEEELAQLGAADPPPAALALLVVDLPGAGAEHHNVGPGRQPDASAFPWRRHESTYRVEPGRASVMYAAPTGMTLQPMIARPSSRTPGDRLRQPIGRS